MTGAIIELYRRDRAAQELVAEYVGLVALSGFVPYPVFNIAASAAAQLRMVQRLARLYEVPLRVEAARAICGTLLATALPTVATNGLVSLLQPLPWVASTIGGFALPALLSASTYALGRTFIQHFEVGGTFLDLDPKAMRAHFDREFASVREATPFVATDAGSTR